MGFSRKWFGFVVVFVALLGCSCALAKICEECGQVRPRRRWSDADLIAAVKSSTTVNQVFTHLGLRVGGGQWAFVKRRIAELELDVSHFDAVRKAAERAQERPRTATSRRGTRWWRWTPEQDAKLAELVRRSFTIVDVVRGFGWSPVSGSAYGRVRDRIKALNLDRSHFRGQGWNRGGTRKGGVPPTPLEKILVENSTWASTVGLKVRLLKEGLLEDRCYVCDLQPTWRGRRLVMRLDHMNGVRSDNRLENLRLLCPNCDAQMDTFAGRNQSRARVGRGQAPLPDVPR